MPESTPSTARVVYSRLVKFMSNLANTSNGRGASLVGLEDASGLYTADDVEAALNEVASPLVVATVTCADAGGGGTTALMTVQLKGLDNSTAIGSARQVLLYINSTRYSDAHPSQASVSLGSVTAGSIVATPASGLYLIQTNTAGLFACTVTNTDDETLYFSVGTALGGVSDITKRCLVIGSNSDSGTWSA